MGDPKVRVDITANTKEAERNIGLFQNAMKGTSDFIKNRFVLTLTDLKLAFDTLFNAVKENISKYADLQTKMVDVGNLYGSSREEVDNLTDGLLEMSRSLPTGNVQDLANALYEAISAGVPMKDSLGFIETASRLATAGVTDTQTAVSGLTTILNSYGKPASDALAISDALFAAQVKGTTTVKELADAMGFATPIAAQLGVPIEELLGMTANLTVKGVDTSIAVHSLRAAMSSLIAPTDEAKVIANKLGFEFSANAVKSRGLVTVLKEVLSATHGNEEQLSKLFGRIEAVNAVLSLSQDEFRGVDDAMKFVSDSAGSTEKAFKNQQETLNGLWTQVKNNIAASALELTSKLEPALKRALILLNKLLTDEEDAIDKSTKKTEKLLDDSAKKSVENNLKRHTEELAALTKKYEDEKKLADGFSEAVNGVQFRVTDYFKKQLSKQELDNLKSMAARLADLKKFIEGETKILKDDQEKKDKIEKDKKEKTANILKEKYDAESIAREKSFSETEGWLEQVEKAEQESTDNREKNYEEYLRDRSKAEGDQWIEQLEGAKKQNDGLLDLGFQFATDFNGAMQSMVKTAIESEDGAAGQIKTSLQGILGSGVGSFVSGMFGGVIATGITSILTGIFGSSPVKTTAEYAEEAFEEMVKNTKDAVSGIGKEKTRLESQVDLLEKIKDQLGAEGVIPDSLKSALEIPMSEQKTVLQAMKDVMTKIQTKNDEIFNVDVKALEEAKSEKKRLEDKINANVGYWKSVGHGQSYIDQAVMGMEETGKLEGVNKFIEETTRKISDNQISNLERVTENLKLGEDIAELDKEVLEKKKKAAEEAKKAEEKRIEEENKAAKEKLNTQEKALEDAVAIAKLEYELGKGTKQSLIDAYSSLMSFYQPGSINYLRAESSLTDVQKLAAGGSFIVNKPTRLTGNVVAGEAGAERVTVTPLNKSNEQFSVNINVGAFMGKRSDAQAFAKIIDEELTALKRRRQTISI